MQVYLHLREDVAQGTQVIAGNELTLPYLAQRFRPWIQLETRSANRQSYVANT